MSTERSSRNLLIVDDEDFILEMIKRQLQSEGYNIYLAASGEAGLQIVKANPVGVIVSDQSMPGMDGITFLNAVRDIDDDVVPIMMTGHGTLEHALAAINQSRVFSYIIKPCSMPVLQSTIRDASRHYEVTAEYKRVLKRTYQLNEHLQKKNEKLTETIKELEMKLEILLTPKP